MKTYMVKAEEVERKWYVVDAEGQTLGRLASQVATILRGKHKPTFNPSVDCGDYVIVINSDKIAVTGNRLEEKKYYSHSLYLGGLREVSMKDQMATDSTRVLQLAVRGMLPKNTLGRHMLGKLKVYPGAEHPHQAQQPVALER